MSTKNDSLLHVEYTFLGQFFETQPLPMPSKSTKLISYNFAQKFKLKSDDDKPLNKLKAMIDKDSNEKLKFLLVKKLIGNDRNDCEEVG